MVEWLLHKDNYANYIDSDRRKKLEMRIHDQV